MRLIKVPLHIEFSMIDNDNEIIFKEEFNSLSSENIDPIHSYIRQAKAKGKTLDDHEVLIELIVSLHQKIDLLLNKDEKEFIKLNIKSTLEYIGHETLIFNNQILQSNMKYYARLDIPLFPPRKMPLFFKAENSNKAHIYLAHAKDISDFDAYIVQRERSIIQENKRKRNNNYD